MWWPHPLNSNRIRTGFTQPKSGSFNLFIWCMSIPVSDLSSGRVNNIMKTRPKLGLRLDSFDGIDSSRVLEIWIFCRIIHFLVKQWKNIEIINLMVLAKSYVLWIYFIMHLGSFGCHLKLMKILKKNNVHTLNNYFINWRILYHICNLGFKESLNRHTIIISFIESRIRIRVSYIATM